MFRTGYVLGDFVVGAGRADREELFDRGVAALVGWLQAPAPAAEEGGVPAQAELSEPVDPPLLGLDGGAIESDDFVSPFEDELDVPTFLRRGGHAESDEEAEEPAFLRRSAD